MSVEHAGIEMAKQSVESILPVLAVALPFLLSIPIYLVSRLSEKVRDVVAVLTALSSFLCVALLYKTIAHGSIVSYSLGSFFLGEMSFYVDVTSFLFALITSFIWLLATIYSIAYMQHEHARDRYFAFLILTLGANMGVILTGDLFNLFVSFELLGLSSWVLVIHAETENAMRAGKKYLFMNVVGGLITLFGVFLFYINFGTLSFESVLEKAMALGELRYIIAITLATGFAIKSGMFPVHVWLPEAHPVAPSPASALLSGIMVKAGIYGLVRIFMLLFAPFKEIELWHAMQGIGMGVLILGLLTMLIGGILAMLQNNIKRLLAYSTVSQIGYITTALGTAIFLGYHGAVALSGALMHVLNHALYKSLFFLGAGAIYFVTGELDMRKYGGLWKRMPLTFLAFMIAFFGIIGMPLFNGYISKSIIFESLLEAMHEHGFFSIAVALFLLGSAITLVYQLKMIVMTFFGEEGEASRKAKEAPLIMLIPMLTMSLLIALIGLFPNSVIEKLIVGASADYNIEHELALELVHMKFINIHGLQEFIGVAFLGLLIFSIAWNRKMFDMQVPRYIGVDYYYEKLAQYFVWLIKGAGTSLDTAVDKAYVKGSKKFLETTKAALEIEKAIDKGVVTPISKVEEYGKEKHVVHEHEPPLRGEIFLKEGYKIAEFDLKYIDRAVNITGEGGKKSAFITGDFDLSVVDGAVNGIAETLHIYGDYFRRVITGIVSDYASGIVIGIIFISIITYTLIT